MSVAMFQKGKEFVWEGLGLVMKAVNEAEVEAHKALGWVLHPHETIEVPTETPTAETTPAAAPVTLDVPATPDPAPAAPAVAAAEAAAVAPAATVNPFLKSTS